MQICSVQAHKTGAHFDDVGHDGDLTHARVNILDGGSSTSLEGNKLSNQAVNLMENVTHQLHTLCYDWADVRDYHRAATAQGLSTTIKSEAGPSVSAGEAANHGPGIHDGGQDRSVNHTAIQPLCVQWGNG